MHVDKIDDEDAAQKSRRRTWRAISRRRFQIGTERIQFLIGFAGAFAAVDVHNDHRLGVLDDNVPAARQINLAAERRLDFALNAEFVENRLGIVVENNFFRHTGRGPVDVAGDFLVKFFVVHIYALHVAGKEIADNACGDAAFLEHKRRGFVVLGFLFDFAIRVHQGFQVLAQQCFVLILGDGTDDCAEPFGDERSDDAAQAFAFA